MAGNEFDTRFGRNVAQLRAGLEMSQQGLADGMRAHGHRWTQSTVWSVEQGQRSLKLEEAVSLASVLRVGWMGLADVFEGDGGTLGGSALAADLRDAMAAWNRALTAVVDYVKLRAKAASRALGNEHRLVYESRERAIPWAGVLSPEQSPDAIGEAAREQWVHDPHGTGSSMDEESPEFAEALAEVRQYDEWANEAWREVEWILSTRPSDEELEAHAKARWAAHRESNKITPSETD